MNRSTVLKVCKDLGCCDGCCHRYLGVKNAKAYKKDPNKFLIKNEEPSSAIEIDLEEQSDNKQTVNTISNTVDSNNEDYTNKTSIKQEKDISKETRIKNKTADIINQQVNKTEIEATNNGNENKSVDSLDHIKSETEYSDRDTLEANGLSSPASKKMRSDVCVSCLGVLQPDVWEESIENVKEVLERKRYECPTMACALSAPIATILRERAVVLTIKDQVTEYSAEIVTSLKEAWKWSFCPVMSERVGKTLDSGAVSPLLATFTMDYADDLQELEILKFLSPNLFKQRAQQKKRFAVEFTRSAVEKALDGVSLSALQRLGGALGRPAARARCVSVRIEHSPVYLGGRYIKVSRELPQSPWILQGRRMMEGSVQETIFRPLADMFGIAPEDVEHRLKLIAAGREDVDVRCLGHGRPFAVEITDPVRSLTPSELATACELISRDRSVVVRNMVYVTKEDLTRLKQGEETKCKTYEALCIKLGHSPRDDPSQPITVTPEDIEIINKHRQSPEAAVVIQQKTPLRVLHRRPLLCRTRHILDMEAKLVPGHPRLLVVRVRTSAGTYVKEWCGGDLGRTAPALAHILRCHTDIVALDVTEVALQWP